MRRVFGLLRQSGSQEPKAKNPARGGASGNFHLRIASWKSMYWRASTHGRTKSLYSMTYQILSAERIQINRRHLKLSKQAIAQRRPARRGCCRTACPTRARANRGEAGNAPCGVASHRACESDRLLVAAAQGHSFTSNTASSPQPSSRDAAFARHPAPICCATSRVT